MSQRNFPDWIKAYLQYSSQSESPMKFHFWSAVSTIAGALRRRVGNDQILFQWIPNFYIIFVAPPGIVSKTTTANIAMDLLRDVPEIHMGPQIVTWQALASGFANACTTIMRSNGTIDSMSAMTIVSSELGNLLDPKDTQLVDLLVSLWDCRRETIEKATKTMGNDEIKNPYINIIGCTTPDWIASNFSQYMIGGGFTARCIWVYGEKKRHYMALPGKAMRENNLVQMRKPLVEDLMMIANMEGEYEFTREAEAWMKVWYDDHNQDTENNHYESMIANYLARKQTHLMKLAMVLAASRSDSLLITEEILVEAHSVLSAAELDIPKVFQHVGLTTETRALEALLLYVKRAGRRGVSYQEAYRQFSRVVTITVFEEILRSARQMGSIELQAGNPPMLRWREPVIETTQQTPTIIVPESSSPSLESSPQIQGIVSPSSPSA